MSEHARLSIRSSAQPIRTLAPTSAGILQRKCACGSSANLGSECEECKKKGETLQRQATSAPGTGRSTMPPAVHDVLRSPGQGLSPGARQFFEPRLGRAVTTMQGGVIPVSGVSELTMTEPGDHYEQEADRFADEVVQTGAGLLSASRSPLFDLSSIRIHTDQSAAGAAAAVNAHAFTVGQHVVFGSGSYDPDSLSGLRLIAHELAHTVQQPPGLARQHKDDDPANRPLRPHDPSPHFSPVGACYGSAICRDLITPTKLLAQAATDPQNKQKREQRKQVCQKKPPDPACMADGHGSTATQTEKLLRSFDANRPGPGVKILVDKDLEQDFGALTIPCDKFMPPTTGTSCITVPETMEKEAAQFNTTMDPTISGKERGLWRERTLEILVHESEHVRFHAAFQGGGLLAQEPSCANKDSRSAMNELVAMLSEFPLRMERIRTSVGLSAEDRQEELNEWRNHRILGTHQSITVSLRTVRCVCNCDDANKMIRETVEFAMASWTQEQRNTLHREMRDPRWNSLDLRWPFVPPGTPSVTAT